MLSFLVGLIISGLFYVIFLMLRDEHLFLNLTGWTGLSALIIAMVFSGALVSGDRLRLNTSIETKKERDSRFNVSGILLVFSLPFLIIFTIIYSYKRHHNDKSTIGCFFFCYKDQNWTPGTADP
jgi:hypothetical protein